MSDVVSKLHELQVQPSSDDAAGAEHQSESAPESERICGRLGKPLGRMGVDGWQPMRPVENRRQVVTAAPAGSG